MNRISSVKILDNESFVISFVVKNFVRLILCITLNLVYNIKSEEYFFREFQYVISQIKLMHPWRAPAYLIILVFPKVS